MAKRKKSVRPGLIRSPPVPEIFTIPFVGQIPPEPIKDYQPTSQEHTSVKGIQFNLRDSLTGTGSSTLFTVPVDEEWFVTLAELDMHHASVAATFDTAMLVKDRVATDTTFLIVTDIDSKVVSASYGMPLKFEAGSTCMFFLAKNSAVTLLVNALVVGYKLKKELK